MPEERFFYRHPKATLAVFLVLVFLGLDVASKNIIKFQQKRYLEARNHESAYRIKHPRYHHDLKPWVDYPETTWGNVVYPMATNSLGFKDAAPRPVVLKPNKHRLLFIGDSFTEGVGVPYGETFVGLIAEQLAQKDIGVLNAGVCSYSPAIYYAKTKYLLEKKGLVFNELIVYIDLSDIINEAAIYDIDQGGWVQATPQREKEIEQLAELFYESKKAERSLYQRLEKALERDTVITYLLVKECHDAFFPREIRWDYDSLHLYGPRWTIDKDLEDEFAAAGLQECAHNMDKLYALCKAHGIRLTVAVYPWPDQILHNDLNSRQVAFWRRWAEAHDVQLINHFPQFVSKNSTTAEVRRILDAYFIPGDLHWNAAGHRLIAAHFLDVFQPFN